MLGPQELLILLFILVIVVAPVIAVVVALARRGRGAGPRCAGCGAANPPAAQVCSRCGQPVVAVAEGGPWTS